MFPVTKNYINNIYLDNNTGNPVTIDPIIERTVLSNAKTVLKLHKSKRKVIFPDVDFIKNSLLEKLSTEPILVSTASVDTE